MTSEDKAGRPVRDSPDTKARRTAATEYDGTSPFPAGGEAPASGGRRMYVTVTALIVIAPFVGLGLAVPLLWGSVVGPTDLVLAAVFYVVTGLGVTVGFHRGLTHGSYTAVPALRIALAVAGSLSFQGDVIDWVATHRRHHAFTDRPGDPHSPTATAPASAASCAAWSTRTSAGSSATTPPRPSTSPPICSPTPVSAR